MILAWCYMGISKSDLGREGIKKNDNVCAERGAISPEETH